MGASAVFTGLDWQYRTTAPPEAARDAASLLATLYYARSGRGDCLKLPRVEHFFEHATRLQGEPKAFFTTGLGAPNDPSRAAPAPVAIATNARGSTYSPEPSGHSFARTRYQNPCFSRPTSPTAFRPSSSAQLCRLPRSTFRLVGLCHALLSRAENLSDEPSSRHFDKSVTQLGQQPYHREAD
jgi:hypothetical protein